MRFIIWPPEPWPEQDSAIGGITGHIENSNRGWCRYAGASGLVAVSKVRRAAAFGAHHAGADGVFGRTCVAEQRAVARRDGSAQHVAAAAPAWLDRRFNGHVKAGAGIKAHEFGSDGKTRSRNRSQSAPRGVARLKHLLDQLARYGIAVCS